jgi:hypothetical protein
MDLRPVLTVKTSKQLGFSQAYKLIKKFQNDSAQNDTPSAFSVNREDNGGQLSDDTVDKLSIIANELKALADQSKDSSRKSSKGGSAVVDLSAEMVKEEKSSQKKRKREKSEEAVKEKHSHSSKKSRNKHVEE